MDQILQENGAIFKFLGKPKQSESGYRFTHYALSVPVEDGVLLFNTLTRELLLLTEDEYRGALDNPVLRNKWFVVPENTNEKSLVKSFRWMQGMMNKKSPNVNNYVVYTTTDCNARCFYCFELGRKRMPMSDEMAIKTASFIKENCGGKHVYIKWFGGEPLYNARAIDLITDYLEQNGVSFESTTISNGYLFDDETVYKAAHKWKLKRAQISMDGTEKVYNRSKAYIYRDTNPYQVVMGNIQRLLDQDITVLVRLNLDFHNIEELHTFSEELAERFGGQKKFFVYPRLIIDEKKAWDERYSMEQWTRLFEEKGKLEAKLQALGIFAGRNAHLRRHLRQNTCMADSDNTLIITPDGKLTACEHFSETEVVGHIDSPERNQAVINSFHERWDEISECDTCFYYPQCIRLKKCPYIMPCIAPERNDIRITKENTIIREYLRWRNRKNEEHVDAEDVGDLLDDL